MEKLRVRIEPSKVRLKNEENVENDLTLQSHIEKPIMKTPRNNRFKNVLKYSLLKCKK